MYLMKQDSRFHNISVPDAELTQSAPIPAASKAAGHFVWLEGTARTPLPTEPGGAVPPGATPVPGISI